MSGDFASPLPFPSWKAKPQMGEPAHGYFVRLVAEQEHVSGRVYANDLEINGRGMRPAGLLEVVLKLPLSEDYKRSLIRWTPVLEPGWYNLAGQKIRQLQLSYRRRRHCKACLAEAAYHRAWWNITSFSRCPFHSCEIEGKTTGADAVRWWVPSFDMSADGDQLAVSAPRREEKDSYEVYLLQRMGLDVGQRRSRPLLDPYVLGEAVDMCGAIGQFLSNPQCERAPPRRLTDYRLGYEALSQDENYLEECFREWLVREVPESVRRRGMHNSVGWIVQGADRNYLLAELWPLARVILQRAFSRVGHIGRQWTHDKSLPHGSLTIKELQELTGIARLGLASILRQLRPQSEQGSPITNETVRQVKSFASRAVALNKAARKLGCSQLSLRSLAKNGHIRLFEHTSLFRQEGRGACVLGEDVERLIAKAAAVVPRETIAVKISLSHYARKNRLRIGSVIDLALKGELPPATPIDPKLGFRSWTFDDPSRVVRNLGGSLLFVEGAATLSLESADFAALVGEGAIKTVKMPGGVAIDRASLRRFNSRFVNARLYKDELGCTNRGFESALAKFGIDRHFAEVSGATALHFVERRQLEDALGISTEVDPITARLWKTFREGMVARRTRFTLPETIGPKGIKALTCTRQTFVTIAVEESCLVVQKRFTSRNSREWKVFTQSREKIMAGMARFNWQDDASGDVVFDFSIENNGDAIVAMNALLHLEQYYVRKT